MGDNCDGIKGVSGIGEKGASDLIKQFGSVDGAIAAAKADDERIKPKKREALIEFEGKKDVTLQLVTLRTDLQLPASTRL
jgi:DNA polymerase-1